MFVDSISKFKDKAVNWTKDKWDKFRKSYFDKEYFSSMKVKLKGF